MRNQTIVTPFFMDQLSPQMQVMLAPGWRIVQPELDDDAPLMKKLATINADLASAITATVNSGQRPVSMAGDCVSSLGVMAGLYRADVKPLLVWFDAHGDFNTPETSPSGFIGGMPLAMLAGRGDLSIMQALGLPPIPEADIILTDARDLDPGERAALESSQVTHLPAVTDLLTYPLPEDRPILVHFDVDIIDADEAPAHRYPAPGGPSADDLRQVFAHLAATGRVAAVSVSAWNFEADTDGKTGEACLSLLATLMG